MNLLDFCLLSNHSLAPDSTKDTKVDQLVNYVKLAEIV